MKKVMERASQTKTCPLESRCKEWTDEQNEKSRLKGIVKIFRSELNKLESCITKVLCNKCNKEFNYSDRQQIGSQSYWCPECAKAYNKGVADFYSEQIG